MRDDGRTVIWFEELTRRDVPLVGGKNASLGEMVRELGSRGIRVPDGFATVADAYRAYLGANGLDGLVARTMDALDAGRTDLHTAGRRIRAAIAGGEWPEDLRAEIAAAYAELSERSGQPDVPVAVRSSATAEDLPDASFAGQQETFLNIRGEAAVLDHCRRCFASLFTDRAISYRKLKGFDHMQVALSVGIQRMVRSDIGGSGVMFSIDTETGFDKVVLISAAWGLGENVVQGTVTPDEHRVFKPFLGRPGLTPIIARDLGAKEVKMILDDRPGRPTRNVPTSKAERAAFVLSDAEVLELAQAARTIEDHYGVAMDMEWARDGLSNEIFIVQARPETVQSRVEAGALKSYTVTGAGRPLVRGLSVGEAAAAGRVCLIEDVSEIDRFVDGAILVTSTTDPDWVPIMKRAAAIVTDHGGRTSHAAIVSRELGLPAIVGTGDATHVLHDEQEVTVNCSGGAEGIVHDGIAHVEVTDLALTDLPETNTKVMLNLANPGAAARWWRMPSAGVGLARMEFVINNAIRAHPLALLHFDTLADADARAEIAELTRGYPDKAEFFVEKLAMGLGQICAPSYPDPVIIRMSDFKTNEYAQLLGGRAFEPHEENPMIGWRGASRYYNPAYAPGFALECRAIKRLREDMGFDNAVVMIPFCRTPDEADRVLAAMAENGLTRGENGLQVYVMCEIPANVILAGDFARRFDGFSIGSNDLTQLTLGVDRDSEALAALFDESNPAVRWMIETVIAKAHGAGARVGFCGQAPSNDPAYARFLVEAGIDTISVTPDSFRAVRQNVAEAEAGGAG